MAFGPEFIRGLQAAIGESLPWHVARVEGGESWVALKVSELWFLLSWGAGAVGCCMAGASETAALKKGAPARAPLVEALKSRIARGDIVAVRQLNHDRILEFQIRRRIAAGTEVRRHLILEATEPVGNLILTDGERVIEELARHAAPDQNRYRTLLPGHPYAPPPAFKGPLPEDLASLCFEDVPDLAGVGRPLTRLIQDRWAERSPSEWLDALKAAGAGAALPCQRTGKGYLTRLGIPLGEPLGDDPLAAAARGVLGPLLRRGRERLLHEAGARLKRAVKSKERHRDGLLKQLRDCEAADGLRRKGETLLAHLHEIPPRAERVTLTDWDGTSLTIELDPRLPPSRNAERYFKKYRRAKGDPQAIQAGLEALDSSIRELMEQLDLLESIDDPERFEEAARDLEEWLHPGTEPRGRTKKAKAEPPHLSFNIDGLTVLVGLSARGNRYVTFRQARAEDIWLHAHELPGAHVIIRGARDRRELEERHRNVLEFAAALAAWHSKGKNSGSVAVDYTERRRVRPVPGTVALVTYTEPGTLRVAPEAPPDMR